MLDVQSVDCTGISTRVRISCLYKNGSNALLDAYGNYSAEPANQIRFPWKKSSKVGATVARGPWRLDRVKKAVKLQNGVSVR